MSGSTLFKHKTEKATVFKNPKSKNLYMSFYHKGRRVQKSTGKDDLQEAIAVLGATLEANKIFKKENIHKDYIETVKVKHIANEVIAELEETKKPAGSYKNYIRALNRIVEKIGNYSMENIDRAKLKTIFDEKMSKTIAQNYRQSLRRIFEKAEDKKIKFNKPTMPKVDYKQTNPRQAITYKQFEALLEHYAAKFYYKVNVRGRSQREIINAKKMYEFIVLAYATGARPGELDKIKGEDFELRQTAKGEVQYILTIRHSKVNKDKVIKRKILVEIVIGRYFYEYYTQMRPKEYVFYNPASKKIISPCSLNRDDKKANAKYYKEHKMEFFVPYCLRHAFITRAILRGTNLMICAQHVGTSPQMITDFYSDIINTVSYDGIYEDQKAFIKDELELLRKSREDRGIIINNNYLKIKEELEGRNEQIKEHFYNKENLFGANFLFETDPLFKDKLNMMGNYYAHKQGLDFDEHRKEEIERFEAESQRQLLEEQEIMMRDEYNTDEQKDDLRLYGDEELELPFEDLDF